MGELPWGRHAGTGKTASASLEEWDGQNSVTTWKQDTQPEQQAVGRPKALRGHSTDNQQDGAPALPKPQIYSIFENLVGNSLCSLECNFLLAKEPMETVYPQGPSQL